MIRRAARHNPKAYVLVTGCYSQLNPGKTAGIDGVDFICGNSNKMRLVDAALGLIASGEKNGAVLLLGGGLRIQPVMAADEKFSGLLGDPVYIFAGEGDLP